MSVTVASSIQSLRLKFPPSAPCSCETCRHYCARPGWWSVAEARAAVEAGYAGRMMLELSPDRSFGVLSPAFRGNEGDYAWREFSGNGCSFLERGLCALFGTPFQPLECRYCHHERVGKGDACHRALERDWDTAKGRRLVRQWLIERGFIPHGFIPHGFGVPPFLS